MALEIPLTKSNGGNFMFLRAFHFWDHLFDIN